MAKATIAAIREVFLADVPRDGSAVGNIMLREKLAARLGSEVAEQDYFAVRDALIASGALLKGQGRGGSVKLAQAATEPGLTLEAQAIPDDAKRPKPQQTGLPLSAKPKAVARKKTEDAKVIAYRRVAMRRNNPDDGVVIQDIDRRKLTKTWTFDPNIRPLHGQRTGRFGQ